MSLLVVVLLVVLWAAVLLPGAVRGRAGASPMSSIDSFERSMDMLAHRARSRSPSSRTVLMPPPPRSTARARAAQRRRMILGRLVGAVGATGLLGLVAGGALWLLFATALAALGGYVVVLFQLQSRQAELRRKVRRMPGTQAQTQRQTLDLHDLAVAEQGRHG